MADEISYVQDIEGTNPDNLIRREPHFITEIDPSTQNALIPKFPPFHPNDFLIETQDDDGNFSALVEKVDFELAYPWYSLEKETAHWVYGGAKIHRKPTATKLFVTYRTVGKPWVADRVKVLEALAKYVWEPRIIQFDQLTNVQQNFPPDLHKQNLDQFRQWADVIAALNKMTEAMLQPAEPTLLFQQQVIYMRTVYDGLMRKIDDMQFEIDTLKQQIQTLQKP